MMKKLIFLFLVIGWCGTGFSQGLTATADKQAILIGEQFSLKLQGFFSERTGSSLVRDRHDPSF
jgi:hypothetical protein